MSTVSVRYIVDDVDAAIAFYRTHLGFVVDLHPAPTFAAMSRGDLRLLLSAPIGRGGGAQTMPDGRRPEPGGWNRIQLQTDDLAATVVALRSAGVVFRNEIVEGAGGKQILLDDPAGNPVELFQPAGAAPTDPEPGDTIAACRAAHQRLLATASRIDDDTARRPSRLPAWTVGHVLTHLARNADGHARRLEGALRGEEVPRYAGGVEQRDGEIEAGARRPARELVRDLEDSARRLEEVWSRSESAGWPNADLLGGDRWPTSGSPLRRLREVEVHHVDLGLGYEPVDWPHEYVQWELPHSLERLPRLLAGPADARRLLAWIIGRADWPDGPELRPWM